MLDDCANDRTTINTDVVSIRVSPQHPRFSTSSRPLKSNPARSHAIHASTTFRDTEYDFILDFLNSLKPSAIRLQGNVMPNNFTPTPLLSPLQATTPKARVPSVATRRAACTHLTMERLYGDYTCNICLRYPSLGWVYCCTQDEVPDSQVTPDSISEVSSPPHQHVNGSGNEVNGVNNLLMQPASVAEHLSLRGEDIRMPTTQLSPWIEKAIKDGHYTPEQVFKLRAQKQHVVDTARAAIHQFEQSQTTDTNSSPRTSTTLQPVDTSSHLPFPVFHEVQQPSATDIPTAKVTLARQAKTRMFPFCKFCACHLCRPTHRDRTWQHFEDLFETEHDIPFIHYEDRNRPLASRSIMSTIGLHPPRIPQRPLLESIDSVALYSRNEVGQILFKNNDRSYRKSADPTSSSTDITDMSVEPESKGFRESMKRAFKGMLTTRQQSSSRSTKKKRAGDETDTTDEDAVEFDMGLWKELNDELLKEASGIPLPGKDSIERLSRDVGRMGMEGVAVTEEAADLGTADVIMSV